MVMDFAARLKELGFAPDKKVSGRYILERHSHFYVVD
jgi:hypothetical protein